MRVPRKIERMDRRRALAEGVMLGFGLLAAGFVLSFIPQLAASGALA